MRLPALLAGCLALSACAVGPDYQRPFVAMPAAWGSASRDTQGAPELARWWTRLNDSMLEALIDEAVAGNLDVAAAKARVREARASYRETGGALQPSLDASAGATRARSSSGTSGAQTNSQYRGGFDASWEIDLFGANARAREAARYGLDAAEEDLRATLLTLIGDVASNYVQARGTQARLALSRRTVEAQRQTAELTRAQYEAGAASALDVANATGQNATTEARIPELEATFAQYVHRLSVLTGRAPSDLAGRLAPVRPIPAPRLPVPTGIPADILTARPDVRLAERRYAQSTARIGQSQAARYPRITLSGSISTSARNIGDLGQGSSIAWSFGPGLSVPLFSGGQLAAAVEGAQAARDEAFLAYHSSVLVALEDVENATVSLAQERIRSARLATAVENYRTAASLSQSLYQAGATSFLDVLDSERSLYSAEDSLIQSRITITTDYIALQKALGGGWDGTIDSSRPVVTDTATGPRLRTGQAAAQP